MYFPKNIFIKIFKSRYSLQKSWNSQSLNMHVKKNDLLKGNFDTIVLGSSHAEMGFYPKYYSDTCYNFGCSALDLYYTKQLFDFCNNNLKNINHFIVFYSLFSPGYILQLTSWREMCILFKIHYNCPYYFQDANQKEFNYKEKTLLKFHKKNLKNKKRLRKATRHYNGYSFGPFMPNNHIADFQKINNRIMGHLKHNKRQDKQNFFIEEIYHNLKPGQKLTIVIPPVREDYKSIIKEPYGELFKDIISLCQKLDIKLLNFYETDSFNNHFFDEDHLDPVGAYHLTTAIKNHLA